jgi:predicted O-methyltransferase YrrM
VRADDVADRLLTSRPVFHDGGASRWDLSPNTLRLLARLVAPGAATIEIGCGGSTAVLAATASRHVAISPVTEERDLIVQWASEQGVDLSALEYIEGSSDEVLPSMTGKFDLALIDGAHNFPVPIVDFHYVRRLLPVGAALVIDDVNIPAIGVVYRFLVRDPRWELIEVVDGRAAAFRRIEEEPGYDDWWLQGFNSKYPDFSELPIGPRVRYTLTAALSRSERVGAALKKLPFADRLRSRLSG